MAPVSRQRAARLHTHPAQPHIGVGLCAQGPEPSGDKLVWGPLGVLANRDRGRGLALQAQGSSSIQSSSFTKVDGPGRMTSPLSSPNAAPKDP